MAKDISNTIAKTNLLIETPPLSFTCFPNLIEAPAGASCAQPQQAPYTTLGPERREPEKVIVLSMDRNGIVRINQSEIDASRLIGRLQEIFKTRSDRTMFVQADDELLFNDVAQLIDAANGAGVERLGLLTKKISAR